MAIVPGAMLRDRFEILGLLGEGGAGTVYRAYDRDLQAEVALKSMRHVSAHSVYRLKGEFRKLADLRHPHLARLGELFGAGDEWFFTMELVDGGDFLAWVRPNELRPIDLTQHDDAMPATDAFGSLVDAAADGLARTLDDEMAITASHRPRVFAGHVDEARLRAALPQLCAGVHYLHSTGRVHQDLKPSNVLVDREGRVVLVDFGLVRDAGDLKASGNFHVIEGTVAYMAPERAVGKEPLPASDWYSVGVMIFEALTGQCPFEGDSATILAQKMQREAPRPSEMVHVPPDLDDLCALLLQQDPEERPTYQEIRSILGHTRPSDAPSEPAPAARSFIGRQPELAALHGAFEETRGGRAVVVRVQGSSGVGKSALARRFLDSLVAERPHLLSLHGRCYATELVPYKAWDGIVDALSLYLRQLEEDIGVDPVVAVLPRDVQSLARVVPVLRRVRAVAAIPPSPDATGTPEHRRRRAFDALRTLFRSLTRASPLVLWIDDFHWADRDSELLLEDLVVPADSPPALILLTERPGRRPTIDRIPSQTVELGPLSAGEAHSLAQELAGEKLSPTQVEEAARDSGGHPMFLQQLVHRLPGGSARASLRLDDVIRQRVGRLAPAARRVLEVVCVAGAPTGREVLQRATGLTRTECLAIVDELRADQLLQGGVSGAPRIEPYHDRIREAVLEGLSEEVRRGYHAALADAIAASEEGLGLAEDDPVLARDLVRHLAAAGDRARAAEAAEAAARRAAQGLAFDHAADLYRLALTHGSHSAERQLALRLALSIALTNAGRGALEAAQGFLAAADAPRTHPDTALELRTRALEQLAVSGHAEQALELLRRLCHDVGVELPTSRVGAFLSVVRRRLLLRLRGLPASVEPYEGPADAVHSAKHQLYFTAFMHLPVFSPLLAVELHSRTLHDALRSGETEMLGLCLCREAGVVLTFNAGLTDRSARALELGRQALAGSPHPDHAGWIRTGEALQAYFLGRFETSVASWREAYRIWANEARHYQIHLSQISVFIQGCLRYLGRLDELHDELLRGRREGEWRGNRYLVVTGTIASNLAVLAIDGVAAAREELEAVATDPLARVGGGEWYLARGRAELDIVDEAGLDTIRTHLRSLRPLRFRQLGRVVTWGAELQWLLGRLELARADRGDPGGLSRARASARTLQKKDLSYARVWGRMLEAGVRFQRGDLTGSRAILEDVAVRAELEGYTLCAAGIRLRLAEIGGLVGDEALVQAYRVFERQGIADVDAMVRLLLPGFRSRTLAAPRATALPAPKEPAS